MLNEFKAAIFDMDGTIIDSMWVWHKVDQEFLAKRGIQAPEDLKSNIEHLTFLETAEYFKNTFKLQISLEEIMKEWNDMADEEYSKNVKLKSGAFEYISYLKNSGVKVAIATSNCIQLIEKVLKNNGVFDLFDCITTVDEVSRGKSFPDIYLLTASKLGVSPNHCLVFEDILPAVIGAKSAGMQVIGVHDSYSLNQEMDIRNHADKFIYKFEELLNAV